MQENDEKSTKTDSSIGKNEKVESSHSKRGATSHSKCGFSSFLWHLYMDLFALYFGQHIIFGQLMFILIAHI
jgi:hypothetical protein